MSQPRYVISVFHDCKVNAEQIEQEAKDSNEDLPVQGRADRGRQQAGAPRTVFSLPLAARLQPQPCLRHAFVYRKNAPTARKPAIMEAQEA